MHRCILKWHTCCRQRTRTEEGHHTEVSILHMCPLFLLTVLPSLSQFLSNPLLCKHAHERNTLSSDSLTSKISGFYISPLYSTHTELLSHWRYKRLISLILSCHRFVFLLLDRFSFFFFVKCLVNSSWPCYIKGIAYHCFI